VTSWRREPLGALGTWFGGGTPSKSRTDYWQDGHVPWLSPKDMGKEVLTATRDHVTDAAIAGSATRLVQPNSVAVVVRSGILERTIPVAVVPFATTLNQDMKAIECRPDVDPRWVAWGLRASERDLLRTARKAGTTVASLEWPRFLKWELPVPALDEQQRIVNILEDHLSRLDAADATLRAVVDKSRALEQSVMDQLVWSIGAPTRTVEELLREPMRNGFSARASTNGDVRILTLSAVTRRTFSDEFTKLTTADKDRVKNLWLEPGDILVQRSNTPELVGSCALYQGPPDWAVFPDLLIRLRTDPDQVRPEYLCRVLQTERSHRALRAKAKGLAGSMPKVDQGAIGSLPVPTLTSDEQTALLERIAEYDTAVGGLDAAVDIATRRSSSLRRALLAAAFSGRLTGRSSNLDLAEEMSEQEVPVS